MLYLDNISNDYAKHNSVFIQIGKTKFWGFALFSNMKILIFLLMLAKFVRVNKGKAMVKQ